MVLSVAKLRILVNFVVVLRHSDYNECKYNAPTKNSPFHTKIHPFKKAFLCDRIKMLPSKKQLRSGKYEEVNCSAAGPGHGIGPGCMR